MADWIYHLCNLWHSPTNWEHALNEHCQNHLVQHTEGRSVEGFSENILSLFQQLRHVPGFSEKSDELLPVLLLSGNIKSALQQLHDFCLAFTEHLNHPFDFSFPQASALLTIFGRSEFLARRLINRPQLSLAVLESPFLNQLKPLERMSTELRQRLNTHDSLDTTLLKKELRLYKYEEFLRVTIRDLAQLAPLTETLEEITSISTCCVQVALEAADQIGKGASIIQINRTASDPVTLKGAGSPFIIIGMGKLGGNELNYSSDIDPIFISTVGRRLGRRDAAQPTGDEPHERRAAEISNKILGKIARCLIDLIGDITEDGFVARVDMRLRPGGETAPLFQSVQETETYYETKAETWERQALIKARVIAGDQEQGQILLNHLSRFIFKKELDENMLQEIKNIKQRIEKEHLKEHLNVKLGVGGIREIEFFVQMLQLLYGGVNPSLRSQNTLNTISTLALKYFITESQTKILTESYIYLRTLEHRLQMVNELQTHVIPSDVSRQQILARHMAYDEEDMERARRHLLQDVKEVMIRVRTIFGGLFDQEHLEFEAAIRNNTHFSFIEPDVQNLIEQSALQFSAVVKKSKNSGLNTRFQNLFERISARLDYYQYLLDNPATLQRLTGIAETSEFLWNYLLNHLDLLKQLDATEVLYTKSDWESQLTDLLNQCDHHEEQLDVLRNFKHTSTFLIGSAELEGILTYEQARQRLTMLAEVLLQASYQLAKQQLKERFGEPLTHNKPTLFAVIGMGKLGGSELTYHSDLDLIFLCSDIGTTSGPKAISNYEYYAKLIKQFISILSSYTQAGIAYKIDTRLRPAGQSGPLVSTLASYREYHETSLPWEHQALIKGRIVGGDFDEEWISSIKDVMINTVQKWTPPDDLKQQITHLRHRKEKEISNEKGALKNIKEGYGGLLDIEFLAQYLYLTKGRNITNLRGRHTLEALSEFQKHNIIDQTTSETLIEAYTFFRLLESYNRLVHDTDTNMIDFDHLQTETIVTLLHNQGFSVTTEGGGPPLRHNVFESYQSYTHKVRAIFNRYM